MRIRKLARLTVAALTAAVLLPALPAQALTAQVTGEIRRTLTMADLPDASTRFGGCMVALSVSPSDKGLDCQSRWITLSCTGVYASKSSALRMYDSAQLAFVAGRTVRVWVDDTKKHNSHCFAFRVDVLAPRPEEREAPSAGAAAADHLIEDPG